jgi:hypothetical protein
LEKLGTHERNFYPNQDCELPPSEVVEKLKILSFQGALHAEESLFSWVYIEEGFLASLGMTKINHFSRSWFQQRICNSLQNKKGQSQPALI